VSQLALHLSNAVLCARLQAVSLHFSRKKNISPPGSTQPCSHALAKPSHNSHPLPTLHSVASSPNARKKRNVPLTIRGFATPPCLAHAHMQRKGTYFAPLIPKHCANGSCHRGSWFLHTSRVYDLTLIVRLSWDGLSALLRFKLTSKGGIVNNQMRPCHHCSNSKTSIHICCC